MATFVPTDFNFALGDCIRWIGTRTKSALLEVIKLITNMTAMLRNGITFAILKFKEYMLATKRSIRKYTSLYNKTNIYEWKITD